MDAITICFGLAFVALIIWAFKVEKRISVLERMVYALIIMDKKDNDAE